MELDEFSTELSVNLAGRISVSVGERFQPEIRRGHSSTMSTASRGAFVLLEGGDRCGKTTQCARLVSHLVSKGLQAEMWRFPDRTTAVGNVIDDYLCKKIELDDRAAHLLFAANRWEKQEEMIRKLQSGITLVVDRYSHSGVAFTAAKGVPGLDVEWCKASENGLVKPDCLLYLHAPVETAAGRGGFGQERYENLDMQNRVKGQFELLREKEWVLIDANRTIEEVEVDVQRAAEEAVEACKQGMPIHSIQW